MTAQEMWECYTALNPNAISANYEAWCYGAEPDTLAALTLSGTKKATSSAYDLYALTDEELPQAGEYSIILNASGDAVCVIRNVCVSLIPYRNIDARHAFLEGEGDRTLAHWRSVHEAFFRHALREHGLIFTEDIIIVCEEFEVVYP